MKTAVTCSSKVNPGFAVGLNSEPETGMTKYDPTEYAPIPPVIENKPCLEPEALVICTYPLKVVDP